ncbi:hypothetical protein RJ641_023632 [Dillenia turbinata]|uniref:Microtubule-binding protein TANGLED n=1 Tax=Dillenia turbinata TaxID=194707 RepID=A0AAN8UEY0_9MAGN
MAAPLNPNLLRETVKKVDKCMARLQELQYTVAGGSKVVSGVTLSPRSTRGYLKTSLRCKQEFIRIKNAKSPPGKLKASTGEWRRMSLPAMLVGETVGEILQASQFAREIVAAVTATTTKLRAEDPKTPTSRPRKQRPKDPENTELRTKRNREKQSKLQTIRSESDPPSLQRARSRITFKVISPPKKRENEKDTVRYFANRISPKHKPWAKKTVLFPNPLFHSSPSTQQRKFCKTRSPVITKTRQPPTPHKFLIKTPPSKSKFQVQIKNPTVTLSPPKMSTAAKLRRSFSPSRLANRLVSPLKGRRASSVCKSQQPLSGLKQRPMVRSS